MFKPGKTSRNKQQYINKCIRQRCKTRCDMAQVLERNCKLQLW